MLFSLFPCSRACSLDLLACLLVPPLAPFVPCLLVPLLASLLAWIISGERLTAADGLDSAEWQEAWSGSDDGDELDQLEVTAPS